MFARGSAIRDVIVEGEERLRRAEAERRASFEAVVRRHAIRWEWRHVDGLMAAEVVVHARYSDLAIIARGDPSEHGHTPAGLLEALVLTSGRPIVVLPPRFAASRVRRILLGWNATPEATRAAAGALQLLVRAEAVEVLVVDRNGEAPGHGQEPGADIAQHLARHGARVEVRRLSSGGKDAGHVLLAEAAAFGHSRLRERVFGGVTRTALLEAALPVLLCR